MTNVVDTKRAAGRDASANRDLAVRATGRRYARRTRYVAGLLAAGIVIVPMPAVVADETSSITLDPAHGATTGGERVVIEGLELSTSVFAQVEAGGNHSLALTKDGKIYGWGDGWNGQLGVGEPGAALVAEPVDMTGALAGVEVEQIATGDNHSLALATDGRLFGWGLNSSGELGEPYTPGGGWQVVPAPRAFDLSGLPRGAKITKIEAEGGRTTVLLDTGELYAWGYNSNGELGNGTTTSSAVPVAPQRRGLFTSPITDFAVGSDFTLVVANGRVYAWGSDSWGQLGDAAAGGGVDGKSLYPVVVDRTSGLTDRVVGIGAGSFYGAALTENGKVFTWGMNKDGQLGTGGTTDSTVPVAVDTSGVLHGKTITTLVAGYYQVFVMDTDDAVYAWGYNFRGQLGIGTTAVRSESPAVVDLGPMKGSRVLKVASGYLHSLAVDEAGRVYGWGAAGSGQLGVGETTNDKRIVPTLVLTHGVYFESPDARKPATDVSVNLVTGTIEATTPAFLGGDATVYVEPVFVPDAP